MSKGRRDLLHLCCKGQSHREQLPAPLPGLAAPGACLLCSHSCPCAVPVCPSPGKPCLGQAEHCCWIAWSCCPCCFPGMGQSHGILKVWVTLAGVVLSQLLLSLPLCTDLGSNRCPGPGKCLGRGWLPCDSYWLCCISTFILLGGKEDWGVGGDEWGCFFPSTRMEW